MDVEAILHKLEDEQLIRLNRPIGEYYSIYCPMPHTGGHYETRPSCGVLLHDQYKNGRLTPAGWTHCFSCGWAKPLPDTLTEILKRKNISKTGLDWLKENIPDFDGEVGNFDYLVPQELSSALQSKYAIDYINSKIISESSNYVSEQELASYRLTVPYMYQRGLTDEIIEKYEIAFLLCQEPKGRFPRFDARNVIEFLELFFYLQELLGISGDECTPDRKFSLTACRCIGACGLAPVLTVNEEVYGRLSENDVEGILAKCE